MRKTAEDGPIRQGLERRILKTAWALLFVLISLAGGLPAEAATYASEEEHKLDGAFFTRLGKDFTDVMTSPKEWEGKDILKFSAVLGTGLLLYAADEDVFEWIRENRTPDSSDKSHVLSSLGDGVFLAGLIGGFYVVGELTHVNSLRKTALLSLESWAITSVIVLSLKTAVGRARPQSGKSSGTFHPFSTRANYTSFPSGHASSAFAVATTIADQTDNTAVDIAAYGLATLVALSRVHDDKHWVSDAFIGSAIGYFVAKKVASLNRPPKQDTLSLSFNFSRDTQAISFHLNF